MAAHRRALLLLADTNYTWPTAGGIDVHGGNLTVSRKLVNFRTLTWQSSQGESKEDSTGPPTF